MIKKLHYVWFGPKVPPRYMYYSMLTAYKVYGVKPTLWISGCDVPEYMLDVCVPADIPAAYLNDISKVSTVTVKCDYVRYRVLADHLGLYTDSDTIHNKSIEHIIGSYTMVVGDEEFSGGRIKFRANNAVMYMSASYHASTLADMCIEVIRRHNYNPVFVLTAPVLVTEYCKNYFTKPNSDDVLVLPKTYFYKYSWREWKLCFREDYTQADLDDYYIVHYWNTYARDYIDNIDDQYVMSNDNLYTHILRKHMQ